MSGLSRPQANPLGSRKGELRRQGTGSVATAVHIHGPPTEVNGIHGQANKSTFRQCTLNRFNTSTDGAPGELRPCLEPLSYFELGPEGLINEVFQEGGAILPAKMLSMWLTIVYAGQRGLEPSF